MGKFLVIVLALCFTTVAWALPAIELSGTSNIDLNSSVGVLEVFEEKERPWTITEVHGAKESPFHLVDHSLNFGFTNFGVWLRFKVNNSKDADPTWLVNLHGPFETVDLFEQSTATGEWLVQSLGVAVPYAGRTVKSELQVFQIKVPLGTEKTLYVRAVSNGSNIINIHLQRPTEFYAERSESNLILLLYFGGLLVMLVYNLFLYVSVRDPAYIHYVLFLGAFLLLVGSLSGHSHLYLWPESSWLAQRSFSHLLALVLICVINFHVTYLNMAQRLPRLNRLGQCIKYLTVGCVALAEVWSIQPVMRILLAIALPLLVIGPLAAGLTLRQGYRPALFLLAANVSFYLAAFMYLLALMGVIPEPYEGAILSSALPIGSWCEIVLFSVGLGDRINSERREKAAAQRIALHHETRLHKALDSILACTNAMAGSDDKRAAATIAGRFLREYIAFDQGMQCYFFPYDTVYATYSAASSLELNANYAGLNGHAEYLSSFIRYIDGQSPDELRSKGSFMWDGDVCIPICSAANYHGLILCTDYGHPELTSQDADYINTLASSIGSSFDGIDHADKNKINALIEAELKAASDVQTTLLPKIANIDALEIAGYYTAAAKLGGDWYGTFHDQRHSQFYFLVGDVTGHGIPSALISAIIAGGVGASLPQIAERDSTTPLEKLSQLASTLNHLILDQSDGRLAMTMFIGCLELVSGHLHYLSAGHNPAIWIQSDLQKAKQIKARISNSLGLVRDSTYETKTLSMSPGDTIIAYTDGLVENHGPATQPISPFRLCKRLGSIAGAIAVKEFILSEVNKTWTPSEAEDDCSLLAVTWLPNSIQSEYDLSKRETLSNG